MLMNPPYFNPNMMGYGLPIRNEQMIKNDDKSKRTPHYPSMYYHNPWGTPHYMIPPPPGPMLHPNSNNERMRQQLPHNIPPNIPPNLPPNIPPNIPPNLPYQMIPNSNNVSVSNQMLPHKMNVCLPYEMDPRYYMGYPPPYLPKKT
jgi:splicing factor 3B subunit 4